MKLKRGLISRYSLSFLSKLCGSIFVTFYMLSTALHYHYFCQSQQFSNWVKLYGKATFYWLLGLANVPSSFFSGCPSYSIFSINLLPVFYHKVCLMFSLFYPHHDSSEVIHSGLQERCAFDLSRLSIRKLQFL